MESLKLKDSIIKLEKIGYDFFSDKLTMAVIGFFDGVHIGHKKIIEECVKKARDNNGTSIALTFNKPPANIIRGTLDKKLIISFSDKVKLLKKIGIDYIVVAKFNKEFAQLEPSKFCQEILVNKLNVKEIFIGEDFKFGKNAEGDVNYLEVFFKNSNIKVNKIETFKLNGIPVSSTAIRNYYSAGDIDSIIKFLGRIPSLKGKVIHGDKRGRLLGFPTANIDIFERYIAPKDGVYIGLVKIFNKKIENKIISNLDLLNFLKKYISEFNELMPAVINIGNNPTFKGVRKWVEAHIIDFNHDIYNKKIEVFFIKRLRDEITFTSKQELILQIQKDIKYVKDYFNIKN